MASECGQIHSLGCGLNQGHVTVLPDVTVNSFYWIMMSLLFVYRVQGMKVSCTHFQCAAWAFQHLRDNFDSNSSPDMNHNLLTFQSNIMLVCYFTICTAIGFN